MMYDGTNYQSVVVERLEQINQTLKDMLIQNREAKIPPTGKSAFQTSDMNPPKGTVPVKMPDVAKPNSEDAPLLARITDPLDAEIRLHMSKDVPIG